MTIMTQKIEAVFESLWKQYTHLNPQAEKIHKLFTSRGEKVINDHIALRTFNTKKLGMRNIINVFFDNGYQICDEYDFEQKKLDAIHLENKDNPELPKVFISELRTELFSTRLQEIIAKIDEQVSHGEILSDGFIFSGRTWNLTFEDYIQLLQESEYAAWTAAYGFRANHFTVSLNHLTTFFNLQDLNSFLLENGIILNESGGLIKGSPEQLLEQSSTMAPPVKMEFDHSTHIIPGCFYEFAKRYPLPESGRLFQGFIAKSADKIFESTNTKK